MRSRVSRRLVSAVLLLPLLAVAAGTARTQEADTAGGRQEPLPDELVDVGITEHLNEQVPLDLEFTGVDGEPVVLGEFFDGERPVLLNLVYYTCPMLCGLVLNGVVEALREIPWTAGNEFRIVTVSIDPSETATLAQLKKQVYIKEYGRPEAAAGWHFLVGREENIRVLADAVGFGYTYNEKRGEYVHAAGIFICTPDGRLSRYLYGIQYDPRTVRLSLLEASEGKIGSPLDKILLYCFHFDAAEGRYAPAAMNLMRAGGTVAVLSLGIVLSILWKRDRGRRREEDGEE